MAPLPRISDPQHVPIKSPNVLQRIGLKMLNDERDLPFLSLMASFTFVIIALAAVQFFWIDNFWLGAAYSAILYSQYFGRCILMLHNTSHRVLFKPEFAIFNYYIPLVMCPFFGQPMWLYYSHHLGMHHTEGNLEDDLSSTMLYQRDSLLHFAHYWGKFMLLGVINLIQYLWAHNRKRLAVSAIFGELSYICACIAGLTYHPRVTFFVFILPFFVARFFMMWGNWAQHVCSDLLAFVSKQLTRLLSAGLY